jgi:farnesyl diphosphate synthase
MGIATQIKLFQHEFETYLTQKIESADISDIRLKEAMSYSLLLGGKRIRPFLVRATGELFGANKEDLNTIAVALEAIHTYSLIHDDLPAMDDDNLRRGQPTCHRKFDDATAILAGDTLQSFAFSILTESVFETVSAQQQIKIINVIADAASKMCAGQSIDLQNTNEADVTLAELENMHALKTGAMINASVMAGAIAGNATDEQLTALEIYADAIGLAFQVWDDVLDITSDTETLGKPQGSDEAANKTTYPALLGLDETKQKAQDLIAKANSALANLPNRSNLIEPDYLDTNLLARLAHYIIERDY